jgi:hypothetical protein
VASADDFLNLDSLGLTLVDGVLTGSLHFEAGQGTQRFTLEADHDFREEADERFAVMVGVTHVDDVQLTTNFAQVDVIDCMLLNDFGDVLMPSTAPEFDPVVHPVAMV